jgi:hypothetical protein
MDDHDENDLMLPFLFDLKENCLIYVDCPKSFLLFKEAMKDCILAGIDTERRPNRGPKINPTSLLQIATRSSVGREKVFLIDLLVMRKNEKLFLQINDCLTTLMLSKTCYKIGQGLLRDFIELYSSYHELNCCQRVVSVVDTETLYRALNPEESQMISLKKLVKNHLHLNLVKAEQMSDWAERPLTRSQIHYAACDALVLLRLYDALSCEIEEHYAEQNIEFDMDKLSRSIEIPQPLPIVYSPKKVSRNQFIIDSPQQSESEPALKKLKSTA